MLQVMSSLWKDQPADCSIVRIWSSRFPVLFADGNTRKLPAWLEQAEVGMLSVIPSLVKIAVPGAASSSTSVTGTRSLAQPCSFVLRGPLCVALPDFRMPRLGQRRQQGVVCSGAQGGHAHFKLRAPVSARIALQIPQKRRAPSAGESHPAKRMAQAASSPAYRPATPAPVDTFARPAQELHKQLAQCVQQL